MYMTVVWCKGYCLTWPTLFLLCFFFSENFLWRQLFTRRLLVSAPASLPRIFVESVNLFGCHAGVSGHGKETKPRNRTSATSTFVLFSDASTVRYFIWHLHLQTNLLAKNTNPPTTKGHRYAAKRKRRPESRGGEQLLIWRSNSFIWSVFYF